MTDPKLHKTTLEYDQRNRRKKSTSPPVDVSGVTGKVALVTEWYYDPVGNLRLVIQPDSTPSVHRWQVTTHDKMNRVLTSKDPMGRVTTYDYFLSGMLESVQDAKGHITKFDYNERDLKKEMRYPALAGQGAQVVDGWTYDNNAT